MPIRGAVSDQFDKLPFRFAESVELGLVQPVRADWDGFRRRRQGGMNGFLRSIRPMQSRHFAFCRRNRPPAKVSSTR
jgi:hypothetical protein